MAKSGTSCEKVYQTSPYRGFMSFVHSPDFNSFPKLRCKIPTLSLPGIARRTNLQCLYVDENLGCLPPGSNQYVIHKTTGQRTSKDNLQSAHGIITMLDTSPGDQKEDILIILDIALDDAVTTNECRWTTCENIRCILNLVAQHASSDLFRRLYIRPVGHLGHPEVCRVQMAKVQQLASIR
jgi:hypothetical protein